MVETATVQSLPVRFAGEGSGVEELTWGQRAAWASMQIGGEADWAGGTMPLPGGHTVGEFATLLAFVMSRHQSLRTRFRSDPSDPSGQPQQVLAGDGEIALDVVEAGGRDPEAVAAQVREGYEAAPYDPEHDWPVRMAVICRDGTPAWFVALYSHMAIDGYGIEALQADLDNLDRARGLALAPAEGIQPMELARAQRSRSALRQQGAALRQWERQLRTIAPQRFPPVPAPPAPRYWEASYSSPATYLALDEVAARTRVHSGTILLAAFAVVLGRVSGEPLSVVRTLVSNRFRPGFKSAVAGLAQSALCVIDGTGPFGEVVRRAFAAQLAAGMHAYYDPRELWALIDRVAAERACEFDLQCYFNDRRRTLAQSPGRVTVTSAELSAALPKSSLRWGRKSNTPDSTCYLHVNAVPDTIDLTLRVDTHRVSPDDLVNCLRGIEEVVVNTALSSHLA